jgi:hypothetical protein
MIIVDLGVGVEQADARRDLAHRALALHRGVRHPKPHTRPTQLGVAQHVFLGVAVFAGDEADHGGKERQRLLARRGEEPLGRELLAQAFQPLEQVAEADVPHLEHLHRERSAFDPVVGLHERDDVVALLEVGGQLGLHRRPDGEPDRRVGLQVFELAVDVAARDAPLGDLALHPDGTEPVDPAFDLRREHADGPRRIDGGRSIRRELDQGDPSQTGAAHAT